MSSPLFICKVMNPDLLICHLDEGATLNMELTADVGKGYVPAANNRPADAPIGLIPIDALYSPVKQRVRSPCPPDTAETAGGSFTCLTVGKTEAEMLRTPNFGRESLNEIKEVLSSMGLRLGMDIPGWPPENIGDMAKKLEPRRVRY